MNLKKKKPALIDSNQSILSDEGSARFSGNMQRKGKC